MWSEIKNLFTGPYDGPFYVKAGVVALILIFLLTAGLKDVLRLSMTRIAAIAGVCYSESIRRRVLWIIPLAIIGLIIVVQLQQPTDEQDVIRQTTKFCLFATGLVVIISTIILACTNLPREIENRVIFTVVTKPTTRLEIIIGKIAGFACMSATILLIMGLFTFGYLHLRAWNLESDLRDRLHSGAIDAISKPTFQHYVDAGLLNAKTMANANGMDILALESTPGSTRRYLPPTGISLAPFQLPPDMWAMADPDNKQVPGPGLIIQVRVGYDPTTPKKVAGKPPMPPSPAKLSVAIYDPNANSILTNEIKGSPVNVPSTDGSKLLNFEVATGSVPLLTKVPFISVGLTGLGDANLWVDDDPANPPVRLIVPVTSKSMPLVLGPINPENPSAPPHMIFTAREGVSGQQLKGDPTGKTEVCVYHFRGLDVEHASRDQIPIELRVGVEKSGEVGDEDVPTQAEVSVYNLKTQKESTPTSVQPENNRPFYTNIPASSVEGGDFDVIVRCLSPDQWLNLKRTSMVIVQTDNSFVLNLFKSTLILWLMSILVTTISVFCSTFLSWPIAVVLTLVILLGRWGVDQLGDAATAGLGRQFVQDFGVKDVAASQALSASVEELNKMLKLVSTVLPDIETFAATDDIDRGISIPGTTLVDSVIVLVGFGLPLTLLAYIFLKNKEVAP